MKGCTEGMNSSGSSAHKRFLLAGQLGLKYECWNFNSGNYLFTTDTK